MTEEAARDFGDVYEKRISWDYFLGLDRALSESRTYCAISEDNLSTYSDEYARLILLSSIHFEQTAKMYIAEKCPDGRSGNIGEIKGSILRTRPAMCSLQFPIMGVSLAVTPLSEWTEEDGKLTWWESYGAIKHNFVKERRLATQENALNAFAACCAIHLYLVENHLKKAYILHEYPRTIWVDRPRTFVDGKYAPLP